MFDLEKKVKEKEREGRNKNKKWYDFLDCLVEKWIKEKENNFCLSFGLIL